MKRRVLLEIDIDDEQTGDSRIYLQGDPDYYKIDVRKLEPHVPLFASLAHELGHFVGAALELPASMLDPRHPRSLHVSQEFVRCFIGGDLSYRARVLRSENEAWDVAECMFDLQRARRFCLESYERDTSL